MPAHFIKSALRKGITIQPLALLIMFMIVAYLLGGSAREDVASLVWLRPIAILVCAAAILTVRREHLAQHLFIVSWSGAVVSLVVLHLVPLPPAVWQTLPGREILLDIDRVAGISGEWRPLTMTPRMTRNALWSMAVPLAVVLLAIQLDGQALRKVLLVTGAIALGSAVIAVVQIASDPHGALYFYRITNNGSAVGLFANRNHQALLLACAVPILALGLTSYTSTRLSRLPRWPMFVGAALFLIPLVLVTGSRSGVVLAAISAGLSAIIVRGKGPVRQSGQRKAWQVPVGAALVVVFAVALTIIMDRGVGLDRLIGDEVTGDLRIRLLPTLDLMVREFFPWGSGIGSFAPVYKIYEPDSMLFAQYVNHAHNDWLELVVTGGVPAVALVAALIVWLGRRAFAIRASHRRSANVLAAPSLIIVLLCGMGSLSDYPLRVPSLAALFMVCLVCLSGSQARSRQAGEQETTG